MKEGREGERKEGLYRAHLNSPVGHGSLPYTLSLGLTGVPEAYISGIVSSRSSWTVMAAR